MQLGQNISDFLILPIDLANPVGRDF